MTLPLLSARLLGAVALVAVPALLACSGTPTERTETPPGSVPGPVPTPPSMPPKAPGPTTPAPATPVWDIAARGVPALVQAHYIDVARIEKVSRFRSGLGHDYSDDAERCRSMKHYFQPAGPGATWGTVEVFAPVSGRVSRLFPEWAGTQVQIQSASHPAFTVILFHVGLTSPLAEGDTVAAGTRIGTHVSGATSSDVAVLAMTPTGRAFVSYFDALPDSLLAPFLARGASGRTDFIITRAERDATPLACNGEAFVGSDMLQTWVTLR